jgi:N-glycosylase/DNA lyase
MISKEYGEVEDGIPKIPKPQVLKDADEKFLESLPMKYKAQALRLKETARIISEDPEFWKKLPEDYYGRRKYLTKLPGVGNKIADCVLAYGLGDGRAVPVDTHILRISRELYNLEGSYDEIGDFFRRRYGEYAALAQLYLYALSRTPNVLRDKSAL